MKIKSLTVKTDKPKTKKEREMFIKKMSKIKMDTPKDAYIFYRVM